MQAESLSLSVRSDVRGLELEAPGEDEVSAAVSFLVHFCHEPLTYL